MMNECSSIGQTYFRDFTARTDMRYNGQRVDGTHAINGRIFLETRFEDFACSYERGGRRMVEFFAQGRPQNAYLPNYGGGTSGGQMVQVTGVASNDVLNVHSGPGTGFRIVGALSNGTTVREIQCQPVGAARWCEIEMQSDMRERGWVNARFLTRGQATNLPSPPTSQPKPPATGGAPAQVTGLAPSGRVNVRSGPGTDFRVVTSLSNGATVTRYGCRDNGGIRWCEVLTSQGATGWMSARYLTGQNGQVTQLPSASRVERVRFVSGSSGTEFSDQLGPGTSVTYILGARNGQNLYFRLAAAGQDLSWQLFNPDGSLLDRGAPSKEYRGQLWQSGDHKVEVTNRGSRQASFNVIFGIQ
jgi:uncharacterized protein YraI